MPTALNQKIYTVIDAIPKGRVASYGQIALLAGRPGTARAVGFALRSLPQGLELPCHRVVFGDGAICTGLTFGGPNVQRQMLESEGITFLKNGKIDMGRFRWAVGNPES